MTSISRIIPLLLLTLLAGRGVSQLNLSKKLVDFGRIKRGEKVSAKISFTNDGNGPLVIQGIQSSCGCTIVEIGKNKVYQRGETGALELTFDSTDFLGQVVKVVTIVTNEPQVKHHTLTVSAVVVSEFEVNPPLADFGERVAGEGQELQVMIRPNKSGGASSFSALGLEYDPTFLNAELGEKDGAWELTIKLKKETPPGFFKETVWVKNNSVSLPKIPIPVRANLQGHIAHLPHYLEFGSIPLKENTSRVLSLTGVEPFKVRQTRVELAISGVPVEKPAEFVKIVPTKAEGDQKKLLTVALSNLGQRSGSVHGKLLFQTSDAVSKEFAVDFYAFFK